MMRKESAGTECLKAGRQCTEILGESRLKIFEDYYQLADIEKQQNFMARHIETKQPKTGKARGRRHKTHRYCVSHSGR